jgi:hypothetical protein
MKISLLNPIRPIIIGIIYLTALPAIAQQNNSLYFMEHIPQCNQLNPATQPLFGFYLGVPFLSSIEINAGNSAIGFKDAIMYNAQLDSTVTFLNNQNAQKDFLSRFKKTNQVFADLRIDLFNIGLRVNRNYYSFNITERIESRLNLPYDLIKFGVKGNLDSISAGSPPQTLDLSTLGIKATWYREYGIGFSREINDKVSFGLRGKLLFGKANFNTTTSEVSGNTSYQSWDSHTSIDINSSIPNMDVYTNAKTKIDSVKFRDVKDQKDLRSILMNKGNMGAALDLGIAYKPVYFLDISASLLDVGYIHWKNNLHSASMDGSYNLRGVKVNGADSIKVFEALMDTLGKKFNYTTNPNPYMTTLSPKLYVGAQLRVLNDLGLSVLTRMEFVEKKLKSQYTFSLNLYLLNFSSLTFSYTIADEMYDNFGIALCDKIGPFQSYLMIERIPMYYDKDVSGAYIPAYAKNINLRFGFNIVLGHTRHKRANKDKPLVEIQ